MTSLRIVEPKHLKRDKKYLVITDGEYSDAYMFQGKIQKIERDSNILLGFKITFYSISSLLIRECIKNYVVHSEGTHFYEFISRKNHNYLMMETRSLRDIMRHIIGDESFNHYLFDDTVPNIFYQELEPLPKNTDIQLEFEQLDTLEEVVIPDIIEFANIENFNYE